MRQPSIFALVLFFGLVTLASTPAHSQSSFASAPPVSTAGSGSPVAAEASAKMVLTGYVRTAAGVLPGAVIKLTGTRQMVVADADGAFHVSVPVGSGPVQATASYAGFADEAVTLVGTDNEVSLKIPRTIVVARHQSLRKYRKTGRKQVRRSLKKVAKASK